MKTFMSLIHVRVLLTICVAILMLVIAFPVVVTFAAPIISDAEKTTASFVDSGNVDLPGVQRGSVQWGDCDNDSDTDVLITGVVISTSARIAAVYRQERIGTISFREVPNSLTGVADGAAAWGDYDRDGRLDIALTGNSGSALIGKIYRNTGNCTFVVNSAAVISGVQYSSVAWGDYDNDGQLDLLLTGESNSGPVTKLYRNNQGAFNNVSSVSLPGVKNGAAVWGDYNRDGRLDILLTGGSLTKVYRNNGNGTFTGLQDSLTALTRGAAAWGDYDNDGDLDILLAGSTTVAAVAEIYRNNNGSFARISNPGLTGSPNTWTTAAWADYNHDGLLDALITTNLAPTVYRNLGTGVFTDTLAGLPSLSDGSAVWGDYDGNRRPDILVTGFGLAGARIYESAINYPNLAPSAPTGLSSRCTGSEVRLSWLAATDDITPSLTYNIRVGTKPGKIDIVAPHAITGTGYHQMPAMGNTFTTLSATVKNLPRGTYYWSVQAIDGAFAGSSFAADKSFVIPCEVYLPVVLDDHIAYFEGPWEQETNNTYQSANGPIRWGRSYYGRNNDTHDFYSVYLANTGTLSATMLTTMTDGVQLQAFYEVADDSHRLGYDFDEPYHLNFVNQPPGWYYIFIYTDGRFVGNQTYTMTVTSP
jgi:hypothetical protein